MEACCICSARSLGAKSATLADAGLPVGVVVVLNAEVEVVRANSLFKL